MIQAEPDAVEGVRAHEEILSAVSSQRRVRARSLVRETALGLVHERGALCFDRLAKRVVEDDLVEPGAGESLLADAVDDTPLHLVELRLLLGVQSPAAAVREQRIVQLVVRDDPGALDDLGERLRAARRPRDECCPLAVHSGRVAIASGRGLR